MDNIQPNPDRIGLDEAYMQMAEIWGRRSKANRLQVGALIVKDRQIISDGYNGMPAGDEDDTCEVFVNGVDDAHGLKTKPEVLHAESNALMKISENGGVGAHGATLYTVASPCFECAKLIRQAKIARVVYRDQYRITDGIDFLVRRGVAVEQLGHPALVAVQPAPPPQLPVQAATVATSPTAGPARGAAMSTLAAIMGIPAPVPPARAPQHDAGLAALHAQMAKDRQQVPLVEAEPAPLAQAFQDPAEDEVAALLRAHQQSLAPTASAPTKVQEPISDGPYHSGFL